MVAEPRPPRTLLEALRHFTPDVADAYVRSIKWPEGPVCPKCGSVNVGTVKSRRGLHQCREKECRKQFSIMVGTIMEGTHLRLDQWLAGAWMVVNCRNGVSSCEIARTIGCKQQSAWHLLHRLRHVMATAPQELMVGPVESDTTMIGGRFKFMHWDRRERMREEFCWGRTFVTALKERHSGRVTAKVISSENREEVLGLVSEKVRRGAVVYCDSGNAYRWIGAFGYTRRRCNHSTGQYVIGEAHVNGLENFFNTVRRAIKGTYIRPAPEHVQAYVDEQVFRFNVRRLGEWDRFEAAMRLIVGHRLTYSALTDGAVR